MAPTNAPGVRQDLKTGYRKRRGQTVMGITPRHEAIGADQEARKATRILIKP